MSAYIQHPEGSDRDGSLFRLLHPKGSDPGVLSKVIKKTVVPAQAGEAEKETTNDRIENQYDALTGMTGIPEAPNLKIGEMPDELSERAYDTRKQDIMTRYDRLRDQAQRRIAASAAQRGALRSGTVSGQEMESLGKLGIGESGELGDLEGDVMQGRLDWRDKDVARVQQDWQNRMTTFETSRNTIKDNISILMQIRANEWEEMTYEEKKEWDAKMFEYQKGRDAIDDQQFKEQQEMEMYIAGLNALGNLVGTGVSAATTALSGGVA